MNKITIRDFNLGGVSDSIFSGIKNSLARMVGWDIHSVAGLLQVNQKMAKISSTTITAFCKVAIDCSDGNKYWFSSTDGKIWKQASNDAITLVHTTTPASGTAGCTGAWEHAGYIYWATQSRLHRILVTGTSDWGTNAVEDWQSFTFASAFHPMRPVNLVLYIGDGNLVHQIDEANTYTASALDIPTGYTITALGVMSTQLLIGAYLGAGINKATIFRWNTWSVSFANSDDVPEEGIWAFLEADNYVLVYAGYYGSIYYYNSEGLEYFKRISGTYSPSAKAIIYPYASAMFKGSIPLFGVSNSTGNPCDQGIWSLGRHSRNYPLVPNLEFPISELDADGYHRLSGVEIGAIIVSGVNVYCSWAYNSTYGVDKLDYSNKIAKPFFETRIIMPDNATLTSFRQFIAGYKDLPANTSLVMKYKANYATTWSDLTEVVDTDRSYVISDGDSFDARTLQLRIEAVSSGNTSPSIDEVAILID